MKCIRDGFKLTKLRGSYRKLNLVDKNTPRPPSPPPPKKKFRRFRGSQQPPVSFWKVIQLSPIWKTIVKVTSSFHFFILFIYFFIPCADAFLFNLIVTLSSSHSHCYMFRLAENLRPYLYYLTDFIMELYILL